MVGWGTCVHGRLPSPNLLFSIFSPIFLHLKLSHFTRDCLEESLPHVRDFSMSQTPTSKPLLQLLAVFFMQNRGRPTTLFFECNTIFWHLEPLGNGYVRGCRNFFPCGALLDFFYPIHSAFSFHPVLVLISPCTLYLII